MNALGFAWRSLVRQPARATLGVLGVAAVGALLFDMLLLSQGLVVSMRDLLDRSGFDIRVSVREIPGRGGRVPAASETAAASPHCPPSRPRSSSESRTHESSVTAVRPSPRRSKASADDRTVARRSGAMDDPARPRRARRRRSGHRRGHCETANLDVGGDGHAPRLVCRRPRSAAAGAPAGRRHRRVSVRVTNEDGIGGSLDALEAACGGNVGDEADLMLVASTGESRDDRSGHSGGCAGLCAMTNEEVVGRLQQSGFTYFRQISTVLTTVTVSFAVLLITVLLTVSVNQRLGEIAALARARLLARARGRTCCGSRR